MGLYDKEFDRREEIEKLTLEAIQLKVQMGIPLTEQERHQLTVREMRDIDIMLRNIENKLEESDSS